MGCEGLAYSGSFYDDFLSYPEMMKDVHFFMLVRFVFIDGWNGIPMRIIVLKQLIFKRRVQDSI
jgi:hypothetical protein